MLRLVLSLYYFLILSLCHAQDVSSYMHNRLVLERIAAVGVIGNSAMITSMPGSPPGVVGDVYLAKDYRNATFMMYDQDKILHGVPAKLDLQRNEFDVLATGGVRALSGALVRSLVWTDSLTHSTQFLVNGKEFRNMEKVPYLGFFQVLSEGELGLMKMTEVTFKEADRSMAQSVGNKDNKFIKKPRLYYSLGKVAIRLPNKRGIIQLFQSKKDEMEKFIKINEIDFNRENHLSAVFDYYNSLVKK